MRNNKGITLIALVITIIILIILASVGLAAILNSDGLINKAKMGGSQYSEESIKETINLAAINASTNAEGNFNVNDFEKYLDYKFGQGNYTYTLNDENGTISVTYKEKTYVVSIDGTVQENNNEEEDEEEYTGPLYTIIGEVITETTGEYDASLRVKIYADDTNEVLPFGDASTTPKNYGEFSISYINYFWYLTTNSGYELYYSTSDNGSNIEKLTEINWEYWRGGKHFYIIKAHNFSIKYKLNGGINCPNTTYTAYSPTFTLPIPMREGYYFTGWTENEEDVPQRNYTITKGTTGNKKFIANWQESDFTVIGEITAVNTGENNASIKVKNYFENTEETIIYSDANTIPKDYGKFSISFINNFWHLRTNDGYELYYSTRDDGQGIEVLKDLSWEYWRGSNYAHYYVIKARNYTITYNLDGGYACENRTYTKYTPTFTLPKPVKNRSRFTGWTGSNGDTAQMDVTITKGTTGNKTYTANWVTSEYTPVAEITTISGVENNSIVEVKMYLENTDENIYNYNCTEQKDFTYFYLQYGSDSFWHIIEKSPNETYYSTTLTSESSYSRFTNFRWEYWRGIHYYVLVKN